MCVCVPWEVCLCFSTVMATAKRKMPSVTGPPAVKRGRENEDMNSTQFIAHGHGQDRNILIYFISLNELHICFIYVCINNHNPIAATGAARLRGRFDAFVGAHFGTDVVEEIGMDSRSLNSDIFFS